MSHVIYILSVSYLRRKKKSFQYLGFVWEGRGILISLEERIEEDDVDQRSNGSEVQVGSQIDQAKAVRKTADKLETADPLQPIKNHNQRR